MIDQNRNKVTSSIEFFLFTDFTQYRAKEKMHTSQMKAQAGKQEASSIPGLPFSFHWEPDALLPEDLPGEIRILDRATIANKINYLHFTDRPLLAHLQHERDGQGTLLEVFPEPCLEDKVAFRFSASLCIGDLADKVRNLVIDDGHALLLIPARVVGKEGEFLISRLPQRSFLIFRRGEKRYRCSGVSAELQAEGGRTLEGELVDFGPRAFRVRIFGLFFLEREIDFSGKSLNVALKSEQSVCFSGSCACLRTENKGGALDLILAPPKNEASVFQPRKVRNPRLRLHPGPAALFTHPLLQKPMRMEVYDLSTSGFSVRETRQNCLLVPGMVIPDLRLELAGNPIAACTAQVVYRHESNEGSITCGIAIVDTSLQDYTRLSQVLENRLDPCAFVSCDLDPEALWEFFFSAGFVYPTKYKAIAEAKQEFKQNYHKICAAHTSILQHFVYQKGGTIYGYHAIVQAYPRTWLIHHHAGRAFGNKMGGLMVLKETMHYLTDMHRFRSSRMKYAMTFFRPENRFPNLVFGRFAKRMKDPKACSVDAFSYISVTKSFRDVRMPDGWAIAPSTGAEVAAFKDYYEAQSGGLLLEAFSLGEEDKIRELESLYARQEFLRQVKVFTLKLGERPVAMLIADRSDRGLNLSELLNCVKVIVLDPESLPWTVLEKTVLHFAGGYGLKEIPVMCYPSEYTEREGIVAEKIYQTWILNVDYGDAFMEYMRDRLRIC